MAPVEKKLVKKHGQVCPQCGASIYQLGQKALMIHCMNKPDHHDLLVETQRVLEKKRQLSELKMELAAEKLAKKAKKVEPSAPPIETSVTTVTADPVAKHVGSGASSMDKQDPPPPRQHLIDSEVRINVPAYPDVEFILTSRAKN